MIDSVDTYVQRHWVTKRSIGPARLSVRDNRCRTNNILVCLLAPMEGFALVPCGHARFCENCARRVADEGDNCPLCRAVISMVMRVFA